MSSSIKGTTDVPDQPTTDLQRSESQELEYEEDAEDENDFDDMDEWDGEDFTEVNEVEEGQDGQTRGRLSDIAEEEEGDEDFQNPYPRGDQDDESPFLTQFNAEFDGELEDEEENIPPRVEVSVESLEEMIRLLEDPAEPEEYKGDDAHFFKSHPCTPDDRNGELTNKSSKPTTQLPDDGEKSVVVLGPDHPRMKRFQAALRKHLQKQIENEEWALRDLEFELKTRRREREELGECLYNLQYELTRQSDLTEKHEDELHQLAITRNQLETTIEQAVVARKEAEEELNKEIEEEKRLIRATKEMDLMEWSIRSAIREYESTLLISQRVDERFLKVKGRAETEKKDQDIYLDRLMLRLQQTQLSNEALQRQIRAHVEEQKELSTLINQASTEIEALQIEKGHLQRAWNETIGVVRSRDEALNAARKTLDSASQELKAKETEIKQLMGSITKEQENHERATVRLKRRKMEERQLKTRLSHLEAQQGELERNLSILHQLRQQVQDEHSKGVMELGALEKLLDVPRRRIQRLLTEKKKLEDEILGVIQEQTSMDKVAGGIARQIQQGREKRRATEDEIAKVENELTRVTYEAEVLRTSLLQKESALGELEKRLKGEEAMLQTQTVQMKYSERVLDKKNRDVQILTNKLQKLTEEQETLGIGRLEEEVQELEKQVVANRTICVELQEKWLKLQDELVNLTGKRDAILEENDLRRKEEFILQRKRERLHEENEGKRLEIHQLERGIKEAQMEISNLNSKLFKGKEEEEAVEKENKLLQNQVATLLKEAELEAIELEDEIHGLEAQKDRLSRELGEAHDQVLTWERKVKMARELKESIKKEQENSMTQLRLAIHHMQVRHNELGRVQEKLLSDMERSLDKRERIIQEAEVKVKRNNLSPNSILINVQREESNLKQKRKQLLQEAKESEEEVKKVEGTIGRLETKIKCEREGLRKIRTIIDAADEKLSAAAIEKHKNLIEVILRQIKYKTLESVNLKRFEIPAHPKEVHEEIGRLEERCYSIVELCDALLREYPQHSLPIKLIKASILPNV